LADKSRIVNFPDSLLLEFIAELRRTGSAIADLSDRAEVAPFREPGASGVPAVRNSGQDRVRERHAGTQAAPSTGHMVGELTITSDGTSGTIDAGLTDGEHVSGTWSCGQLVRS
jgi:hypothetical protein